MFLDFTIVFRRQRSLANDIEWERVIEEFEVVNCAPGGGQSSPDQWIVDFTRGAAGVTMRVLARWTAVAALLLLLLGDCAAAKKAADPAQPAPKEKKHSEPVIEEVTAKQLERVLNEKDFVAVFWLWARLLRSPGSGVPPSTHGLLPDYFSLIVKSVGRMKCFWDESVPLSFWARSFASWTSRLSRRRAILLCAISPSLRF
ncbi:hypothetical protein J6590_031199 [Homalodisca vitripennis]|nr:hypothetical protein J6590_031199 [Homalodisca vitripennis]